MARARTRDPFAEQAEWEAGHDADYLARLAVGRQIADLLGESKVTGSKRECILRVQQTVAAQQRTVAATSTKEDKEALRAAVVETALAFGLWAAALDTGRGKE